MLEPKRRPRVTRRRLDDVEAAVADLDRRLLSLYKEDGVGAAMRRSESGSWEMTKSGLAILTATVSLVGALVSGVAGYTTTKVTVEHALVERPTRAEVRAADDSIRDALREIREGLRELREGQRAQERTINAQGDRVRQLVCDAIRAGNRCGLVQ